jgi:hypothetical protein
MSFPFDHPAQLSHAALSYATWRSMCGDWDAPRKVPPALAEAHAAFERLPPADAALARQLGEQCWKHVSTEVHGAVDPGHIGSPSEHAAHAKLRRELPFLDDWTFDVLWSVAFRYAMM